MAEITSHPINGNRRLKAKKPSPVFDTLKRDIMLGRLTAGESLTELELAARFDCSQGKVREALLLLQEEGLVQRRGHRGTQVSPCTADEAVEMFRLRSQIEISGVQRAIARPSHSLIADLHGLVDAMIEAAVADDELQLASFDRDFHRRLFQDADLPALDPILHRCLVHNHRFKIGQSTGPRDLMATALRHRPLVEAVAAGEIGRVVKALQHHVATIVDFGPDVFPEPAP